jgi:hypothetical protein
MYEDMDPSVTVTGRPLSEWAGDVFRGNAITLAERGAGGGYTWSVQDFTEVSAAARTSVPSPISTHPDYWYAIPFTMAAAPIQSTLEVEINIVVTGGMDIALWCEGVASAPQIGVTTGIQTVSVIMPPRLGGEMRCALLIRSQVGAELEAGVMTYATARYMLLNTNQAADPQQGQHLFLEIDDNSAPIRGWQGTARYHAMRGEENGVSGDKFETWPAPDQVFQDAVAYGADVKVYALGKITLFSLQARAVAPVTTGLPYPELNDAGQPVRASWVQRLARYYLGQYFSAMQYAWIGGTGGVPRSTGLNTVATTPIGQRVWGMWTRFTLPAPLLSTAIRARAGVEGMVLTIMYAAPAPVTIEIEYDGTTTQTVVLPEAMQAALDRNRFEDPGTVSWRHGALTRDQCGSQDIGLHGAELSGMNCDTARYGMASIQLLWQGVISPSLNDLVRVKVTAEPSVTVYIASVSLRELPSNAAFPQMNLPVIAPLQSIEAVSWNNLRLRMEEVHLTRLRCLYSECKDDGTGLIRVQFGRSGTAATIAYTSSPELPTGTVLRFTVDAECLVAGTIDVLLTDGVTTLTLTFGARSVQTADLAITSNTAYTLSVGVGTSVSTGDGRVYLIRIEEYLP